MTDGYWRIRESVPEGRSIVYDAVKNLPGLGRMAYHEQLVKVFHALYPHAVVGVSSGGTGIRIDSRDDGAWSSPFHQEFPFHLRSLRGAVYWTPLVPVSHEMGPVRILDGSHKHGLQPLVLEEGPQARSGVNAIRLRDESNIRQLAPEISVESSPGDLILFDYLTVHASGTNHLRRPRWTVQWRVFDFEGPVGRELSWRTSWSAGASARGIVDSVNRLLEGGLDCE